jgi:hypothetical protein
MRWRVGLFLCLIAVRSAAAQPATQTSKPTAATEAEAKRRFFQGVALARAGNCEAAMAEFDASLALLRRPSTLFNIARCQEKLGHYDAAVKAYEEYLALAPENDPDRGAAVAVIEALRQLLGTLVIESNLPGEVWVGDRRLGEAPGSFLVPGGRHVLEVRRDRYQTVRRQVELAGRQSKTIKVELVELERVVLVRAPEGPRWKRNLFWGGVAATGVTAALGVGFGVRSYQQYKDAKNQDPRLPIDDDRRDIRRSKIIADVFYVSAGALAIGTTAFYFLSKEKQPETPTLTPAVGPNSVGLLFEGRL